MCANDARMTAKFAHDKNLRLGFQESGTDACEQILTDLSEKNQTVLKLSCENEQ